MSDAEPEKIAGVWMGLENMDIERLTEVHDFVLGEIDKLQYDLQRVVEVIGKKAVEEEA